jgi:hypothetical protein
MQNKELRNSTGTISKLDYNTYTLVDRPGQLDYIYKEDTFQICNLTLHKFKKTALLFKYKIKIDPTFTT